MPATIALIAHDSKKNDLIFFAKAHKSLLSRYHLLATANTAQRLGDEVGLQVKQMLPAIEGGDAQIAAQVATGKISVVIFLFDPKESQTCAPNLELLLRVCTVHNVAFATNLATAEAIAQKLRQSRVAHLIFNPVAGQGNAQQELEIIKQLLEPQMQLLVRQTTLEISAQKLAQEAIAANADLVIASGGDGTISAVAGALIGTQIPLGIIPRGTANAFAAALGIPAYLMPIRSACEVILANNTRIVDAASCNNLNMILLAGIGFEAETVDKAGREAKNRWGSLAYIMAGWQQLDEQELFETQIEIDGSVKTFQAAAITIANAAPPTSVLAQGLGQVVCDDGLLDVTIVTGTQEDTKLEAVAGMLKMLGAALIKTAPNHPNVVNLQAKQIRVTTNPPQKVVLDGEVIGATAVELECIPGGLIVFAPPAINKGSQLDNR